MKHTGATFIFKGFDTDVKKGLANFHYQVTFPEKTLSFTEMLLFPPADISLPDALMKSLMQSLLLMLGISYWKLYCPQEVHIEGFNLTKEQANFWNIIYTKGLGEFFYKNQIDFRGLVEFPFVEDAKVQPISFSRQDRSLVLIGGGKDSIVSGELLKKAHKIFTAFVVNEKHIHEETIHISGVEKLVFTRKHDQQLFHLNQEQDTFNGHVPATAINSFIALFAAALYDYRYVIVSNEKSANYGNITYLGKEINHQWSKSEEFEQLLQNYIGAYLTKDITYFSLLRSWTEIAITKLFVQYPQYFSTFSSCNRNFRLTDESTHHWCGECPKCLFVFTMLAAYVSKEELLEIFGKNLFDDIHLERLFRALLGLQDSKPFECVGTPDEMTYGMFIAHKRGEFEEAPLMKLFATEALPGAEEFARLEKGLFENKNNFVPEKFQEILKGLRE